MKIKNVVQFSQNNFEKDVIDFIKNINPETQYYISFENYESKSNHRGINETYHRINEKYYWPFMKNSIQIQMYINDECQQSKYETPLQ